MKNRFLFYDDREKSAARDVKDENIRILVVEDDPGICDIFDIILKRAGYRIEIKNNGEEVLDNKFIVPDLFLIDKHLGTTSGLDLCMHLKNQPQTRDIPVIMVSASPDISTQSAMAGADTFIEKPFNISDLLATVRKYVP